MITLNGINHVALLTRDLDAFLEFYCGVFDGDVLFDLDDDGLRHAGVDIGGGAFLHPFEARDNEHAAGSPELFGRGHVDHFALAAASAESFEALRRRLVDRGASNGTVVDFGAVRAVGFVDPDGHEGELALWTGGEIRKYADRGIEELDAVS
jgi:catechol 2,3-dioxygenase-like lactoylglutathione lyase family enzyme